MCGSADDMPFLVVHHMPFFTTKHFVFPFMKKPLSLSLFPLLSFSLDHFFREREREREKERHDQRLVQ